MLKLINYIALALAGIWLISDPSWEPAIVGLTLIGSLFTIYQKDEVVQSEDPAKYKTQTIIIFILLIASLVIAKPSKQSHKGAMYLLERKVEGVISVNGEKRDITHEELMSNILAGALMEANEEGFDKATDLDKKKQHEVISHMVRGSLTKYYDLYLFSVSRQLSAYSIGVLGYIVARNSNGEMVIINSTEGAMEYDRRTDKLIDIITKE